MPLAPASDAPAEAPAKGLTRRSFAVRGTVAALGAAALGAPTAASAAAAGTTTPSGARLASTDVATPKTKAAATLPDAAALAREDKRLVDYEALELAALYRAGATTAVAVTQAYLDRIAEFNGPFETYGFVDNGLYQAFIRIDADAALKMAADADRRIAVERNGGTPAPYLCGVPMGFKDSIGVEGFKNQNGTTAFAGNVCLQDNPAVARVRAAGVVIIGLTVCSAFSGTTSGNFSANAWNTDYTPGGSSQGSGTATVGRLACATFGEETGGSITYPSAAQGASGIKPSLGLVPIAGVMPLTPGYDVIGPIARSGADAALILNTMLGPDYADDPQTVSAPIPFPELPISARPGSKPLRGTTIGINKKDWLRTTTFQGGVDPQSLYGAEQLAAFNRLKSELEALGATVKDFDGVDMEDISEESNPYFAPYTTGKAQPTLQTIDGTAITPVTALSGASRNDIKYIEAIRDFAADKPSAQQSALLSQYGRVPSAGGARSYDSAITQTAQVTAETRREGERRRRKLMANMAQALDDAGVDLMLTMQLPQGVGKRSASGGSFPAQRAYYQVPNAASWPLVSFPIGYDTLGLPITAQLWGPRFCEPQLVQAMIDYQAHYPEHHKAIPPDPTPKTGAAARATPVPEGKVDPFESNDPAVLDAALNAK
ncbi:amidase [Baekduia sp. Peel2402]|uniref:amidase n=1 Tax=Baekduia sp. Peel2402 TaxID=3458296 RepID=UPI00403E6152